MQKIKLLKKFYCIDDICEALKLSRGAVENRIKNLELTPDIQIKYTKYFCESSYNVIVGNYKFENN